jgi:hypothetical protein
VAQPGQGGCVVSQESRDDVCFHSRWPVTFVNEFEQDPHVDDYRYELKNVDVCFVVLAFG